MFGLCAQQSVIGITLIHSTVTCTTPRARNHALCLFLCIGWISSVPSSVSPSRTGSVKLLLQSLSAISAVLFDDDTEKSKKPWDSPHLCQCRARCTRFLLLSRRLYYSMRQWRLRVYGATSNQLCRRSSRRRNFGCRRCLDLLRGATEVQDDVSLRMVALVC